MTDGIEVGDGRSPQLIALCQRVLPIDKNAEPNWDFFDEIGSNIALTNEDIEWLGSIGLHSGRGYQREFSATLLGQGHIDLPGNIRETLESMAIGNPPDYKDSDPHPPARFRAAAALWEKGDKREQIRNILQEVSEKKWKDVGAHVADRMSVAAQTFLSPLPKRNEEAT